MRFPARVGSIEVADPRSVATAHDGSGVGPRYIEGDEWRATLALAVSGDPQPLVYALMPSRLGDSSCRLDCFRRHIDDAGTTQLVATKFNEAAATTLDAIDRVIVPRLASRRSHELAPGWASSSAPSEVIEAARAGRLHRCLDRGRIGPAMQWRGDDVWRCELHVARADSDADADTRVAARRWVRLVSANHPPVDCHSAAHLRFFSLFVIGDVIIDGNRTLAVPASPSSVSVATECGADMHSDPNGPRRDRHSPRTKGSGGIPRIAESLVLRGEQTYRTDQLTTLVDDLRHECDRMDDHDDDSALELCVDPRFGLSYFDATPISVVRLEGDANRTTVDVMPLARYRHPDDASIVVDRDPRTHRIVEDPLAPALTVPRGTRLGEVRFAVIARDILRKARGTGDTRWRVARTQLPKLLRAAAKAGILVEIQKQPARAGGKWSLTISSGIDWFDLDGQLETPEGAIPLRELVTATRKVSDAIEILPSPTARWSSYRQSSARYCGDWPASSLVAMTPLCASAPARRSSSMPCWRRPTVPRTTPHSETCDNDCPRSALPRRSRHHHPSSEPSATISTADSAGLKVCGRSTWVVASPTKWALARPCKCSRCSRRNTPPLFHRPQRRPRSGLRRLRPLQPPRMGRRSRRLCSSCRDPSCRTGSMRRADSSRT